MSRIPFRWDNRSFAKIDAHGVDMMKRFKWIGLGAVLVVLGAIVFFGYQRWAERSRVERGELLSLMPPDASAVLFADFDELRRAPFMAELYAWAPKPRADADYAQFLKETGFDYERDLDHVAIAVERHGQDSTLLAVLSGRFDRQKFSAYAMKAGTVTRSSGHEIFSVPVTGSKKKLSFAFLTSNRIALTDAADLSLFLHEKKRAEDAGEWQTKFERLAGSPVFAVIRQDAGAGAALAAQAPGGLRSPQLSTLLDQLQWITLAGKPENDRLRVVAEGECVSEATVRQLVDMLNGVVLLAQAGLNDAKTREQLDPVARDAYLELLKSADVSKIDRGDTKSVRLMFQITPKFLEATRSAPSAEPGSVPAKPLPGKATTPKKGHT
jgi:hypothetical protein